MFKLKLFSIILCFLFLTILFAEKSIYHRTIVVSEANPHSSDPAVKLGQKIRILPFTLKSDQSQKEFEQFIVNEFNPTWILRDNPYQVFVLKGDRGKRTNRYIALYNFPTIQVPKELENISKTKNLSQDSKALVWDRFEKFIQQEESYSDYILLGYKRMLERPTIETMGFHKIQIKPGQSDIFENFVLQKWNFLKEVPCMWGLVLKYDSGKAQEKYLWISAFDPGEMRDGYFPQPGIGSELWTQATLPIQKSLDELNAFFVYGPGTEGMYTDYVVVK
jgi:hypothetical protein